MSNLNVDEVSDGWSLARIEEICEVNPRLNKSEIPDDLLVSFVPMPAVGAGNGSIDVSLERPASEVKKGFTGFKQGDVLFAKITPCMENGKMAIVPKVANDYGFGSTEFHVLRPKSEIDARYVYYFVSSQNFRGVAERYMIGAVGQKRVSTTYLKEQKIPLAPPEQQKRIVAEIEKQFSRLDEAVANLKRVKANLKRYKAAVLKAAVEGKLTEEWRKQNPEVEPADKLLKRILAERREKWQGRGKYKEPAAPDTTDLPELPVGWVWSSLGQVIDEPKYGTSKKCDYNAGNVGVLRIPNVANGVIDSNDLKSADFDEKEKQAYALKSGDILTIRSNGSVSLVGKCALVEERETEFLYAGYLIRMRPSSEEVSSEYVMTCMSARLLRRQIEGKAKSTSGVNNINSGELQSLVIPLCCRDEQAEIVQDVESKLSIVSAAESQVETNLLRADRLRQSILKQAFSGKLIPQYPNDEPASVLLDKIKLDKSKIAASFKTRKGRKVSKVKSVKTKKPLFDVIKKNPDGITPERLLADANYSLDEIDIFYEQLALIKDTIVQEKPSGGNAYRWPERPLVILKPKGA